MNNYVLKTNVTAGHQSEKLVIYIEDNDIKFTSEYNDMDYDYITRLFVPLVFVKKKASENYSIASKVETVYIVSTFLGYNRATDSVNVILNFNRKMSKLKVATRNEMLDKFMENILFYRKIVNTAEELEFLTELFKLYN